MNCDDFSKCIDDYLDETCGDLERVECSQHMAECADCSARFQRERELLELLARLRVPEPSPGFFDQALDRAASRAGIDRAGISARRAAVGGAIAAGLVAIALLGIFSAPNGDSPVSGIPELTLALNTSETVRLSFDSKVALSNARLVLELPDGIDVVGRLGQRRIAWNTNIQRGVNVLELPVIASKVSGGILTATVTHESREKSISIQIAVI